MSMKVLAINGSPRTKCNTATLLSKALQGAASRGAETELVHLYKLDLKAALAVLPAN
jgi:multimeric flavodoxin WrbA